MNGHHLTSRPPAADPKVSRRAAVESASLKCRAGVTRLGLSVVNLALIVVVLVLISSIPGS